MRSPVPNTVVRSHKMRFGAKSRTLLDLDAVNDGWHRHNVDGVKAGTMYKYVLPDGSKIPASRHQPDDHGFSEVIEPRDWTAQV